MPRRRHRVLSALRSRLEGAPERGEREPRGYVGCAPVSEERRKRAVLAVRRGLVQAEEKYLVDPDASLGTWFARVHETIAVASRVTLQRVYEGHALEGDELAEEQIGLASDICAEAIRGLSQLWPDAHPASTREDIIELISREPHPGVGGWEAVSSCLLRCCAELEPLANGLREGDLPMASAADGDPVMHSLYYAALHAFGLVYVLC